jgi:hypothetical protein
VKFIVQWTSNPNATPAEINRKREHMRKFRPAGLELIGAWFAIGEPMGVVIVEANDMSLLAQQLIKWGDLLSFSLTPALSADEWAETVAKAESAKDAK